MMITATPTRCTGEIDFDCPNTPVATVSCEASMATQEYCTEHLQAVFAGYCGTAFITYYATGAHIELQF